MNAYGHTWLEALGQTLVVFVVMLAICFGAVAACTPEPEPILAATDEPAAVDTPARTRNATLAVDVTNAAQMHKLGLPTKTDVMSFHVYGHWAYGYMTDDGERVSFGPYYSLPGGNDIWDKLYGIDLVQH